MSTGVEPGAERGGAPPTPSPASLPKPPPAQHRRVLVLIVAAAVVLAGLLGAVVFLAPSSSTPPPSFSEARAAANASIADLSGGGWELLLGLGVDQPGAQEVSVADAVDATGNSCTLTAVPGHSIPANVTVPAYSGSLGAGRAPLWLFVFFQPSSGTYLLAGVVGGIAAPIATLSGSLCVASLGDVHPVPAVFADSVAADSVAWTNPVSNASAFVASDSRIDSLMMVAAGSSSRDSTSLPAGWLFEYAPCGPFPTGTPTSNQTDYLVAVGAGDGLLGDYTSATACPSTAG